MNVCSYPIVQPGIRALIVDFHPLSKRDWISAAEGMIGQMEDAGFEVVITPNWDNGWTRAGSWVREIETSGECKPMMTGAVCCGCGKALVPAGKVKALCPECWEIWKPKHREGFSTVAGY